jgi:hypothetical protein
MISKVNHWGAFDIKIESTEMLEIYLIRNI